MSRQKPCRFTTAEINRILKVLPLSERRLVAKLEHYAETDIETLCKEDKEQRDAATARRLKNNLTRN